MAQLAIEGIPEHYSHTADGRVLDGWRANDKDIRTWKSVIKARAPPPALLARRCRFIARARAPARPRRLRARKAGRQHAPARA